MRWIDCGLLAFRREVISERVPAGGPADLAPLCAGLADEGLLAGFEVGRRFYEIGSVAGRDELDAPFTAQRGRSRSRPQWGVDVHRSAWAWAVQSPMPES
jgi:hypothetical protein